MPAEHHARWTPVVIGAGETTPHEGPPPGASPPPISDGPLAGGFLTPEPALATAGAVAHHALRTAVENYLRHEESLVTNSGVETIHQARVATRRLRSDLRTFRPLFLRAWADDLRSQLRVIGRALGAVRDADVLHERVGRRVRTLPAVDRPAAQLIVELANAERERARGALVDLLATPEYAALRAEVVRAAQVPLYSKRASRPADTEVRALVRRPWKQVRRDVGALGAAPRDEALHEVRISVKRCRYAAEAAIPVLGDPAAGFADALRRLQNRLGDHQDAVTTEAWLRGVTGLLDAPATFVAGQLVTIERAVIDAERTRWHSAWKAVRRARLR